MIRAKYRAGWNVSLVIFTVVAGLVAMVGCRDQKPSVSILPLEGKVEKVDVRPDGTGSITILYFNEKKGQEVADKGEVTKETEIMINGAVGTLADIKVGERVRGEVKIEKVGEERKYTAIKINVDRTLTAVPTGG